MGNALPAFFLRQFEQPETDVAFHGEPWKYASFLEHKDAARIWPAHRFPANHDAARGRCKKARNGIQQR